MLIESLLFTPSPGKLEALRQTAANLIQATTLDDAAIAAATDLSDDEIAALRRHAKGDFDEMRCKPVLIEKPRGETSHLTQRLHALPAASRLCCTSSGPLPSPSRPEVGAPSDRRLPVGPPPPGGLDFARLR